MSQSHIIHILYVEPCTIVCNPCSQKLPHRQHTISAKLLALNSFSFEYIKYLMMYTLHVYVPTYHISKVFRLDFIA